jgi:hypothetical protein
MNWQSRENSYLVLTPGFTSGDKVLSAGLCSSGLRVALSCQVAGGLTAKLPFRGPAREANMNATSTASVARRGGSADNRLSGNWARLLHTISLSLLAGAAIALTAPIAAGQDPPPVAGEVEGIETLTHGPIHEAFAAPTNVDPTPGPLVAKQPPAAIEEEPPALKAEGAVWIPGYWEWDDEMKDFIWVSGNWRVPPPGMRWVPTYWVEAEDGWRRVPGFWISADAGELEYRETPPESLEAGPSGPAPSEDHFWIPGTWNYHDTGFRWRTGYWSPYQANWVWCPARWVWTPAGCVYTAGFWDRRVPYRGWPFAPIRFRTALYLNPGFVYRPWCAIPTDNLFVHLWYRPQFHCYYFGDYYGPRYTGWIPWYRLGWGDHRRHYDPLVAWCRTHYRRQGIDYINRIDGWHRHFAAREDLRPPRTWREQVNLTGRADGDVRDSQRTLGADLRDLARRGDLPIQLTRLDDRQREALEQVNEQLRDLRSQRLQIESDAKGRVAARVPLDGADADRPARTPGARADAEAVARARNDVKLRLPKLDVQTAARIDAALGAGAGTTAGAPARTRNVPDVVDRGPLIDRTGRVDRPDRTTGSDRADEVLRDLRDRGALPDNEPRATPRVGRTPRVDLPDSPAATPREPGPGRVEAPGIDQSDRVPQADPPGRIPRIEPREPGPGRVEATGVDQSDRVPQADPPGRVPRIEPREPGPGRVEAPGVDQTDRVPGPNLPKPTPTQSDRVPRPDRPVTPKVERPNVDRPRVGRPEVDVPRVVPRAVSPRSLPDADVPRGVPRDIPRVTPRTEAPRTEVPRSAPRIDIPRVNPQIATPRPAPRVDIPRSTPRIEIPRSAPRVEIPRATPRVEIPRSAPRTDIPRANAANRNRDRD